MASKVRFFLCKRCGNLVTYLDDMGGKLVCCNEDMTELFPNSNDASLEKHVPYVKKLVNKLHVQIGTDEHPMLKEHYIKWIALHTSKGLYIRWLCPSDRPAAMFRLDVDEDPIAVYEYCNLHGLWVKEL